MTIDVAKLPSTQAIDRARLPEVYKAAQQALAKCEKVDECKSWSDKALAIASYARQQKDKTLYNHAVRIQVRATRRIGELLEAFKLPPEKTGRPKTGAGPGPSSQRSTAASHGLSERQEKVAKRLAAVPAAQFEELVEAAEPASREKLAALGSRHASRAELSVAHRKHAIALRRFISRRRRRAS